MDQAYSHHHVVHAHHSGLIIGTIAGSCAVTVLVAVALITISPKSILHPLSLTSQVTIQPDNAPQIAEPGAAATQAANIFPKTHGNAGAAGLSLSPDLSH